MNMKEWARTIIAQKERLAIPIMTHPGIEMIGKRVVDAVTDGNVHADAIIALSKVFPSAATTVIMDLTLEAEAFGCKIEFQENDMPHIIGQLVYNADDVEALKVPDITAGRVPQYLKANRFVAEAINDKPVLSGVIGPFSLAGRLFNMSDIMVSIYIEPDMIKQLLEKCALFITNYCRELKKAGCDGVVMAEPAAGLLSNDDCMNFSTMYVKAIIDAVQDDDFMVVLHNCGNKGHCTEAMVASGAKALHFGNAILMNDALENTPCDILVMGNIDPVGILKMGTPESIKSETLKLLENTRRFDNYILSTGCDLPPGVPEENIGAFYEALDVFNNSLSEL